MLFNYCFSHPCNSSLKTQAGYLPTVKNRSFIMWRHTHIYNIKKQLLVSNFSTRWRQTFAHTRLINSREEIWQKHWNRERRRESKSEGKWHQHWEWDDRESQWRTSRSGIDVNAILWFTGLVRHTWDGPVNAVWHPERSQGGKKTTAQLLLSTFFTGLYSPVPQTVMAMNRLCGPSGVPVNQGPLPSSGGIQIIATSWEFKAE